METSTTQWTREEFITYLLLYAALTDEVEDKLEARDIVAKFGQQLYDKVHFEFLHDSAERRQLKIKDFVEHHDLSNESDKLLQEIDRIFYKDGHYDDREVAMYRTLKEILEA